MGYEYANEIRDAEEKLQVSYVYYSVNCESIICSKTKPPKLLIFITALIVYQIFVQKMFNMYSCFPTL